MGDKIAQAFGPLLNQWDQGRESRPVDCPNADAIHELVRTQAADVLAVHPIEFREIEHGSARGNALDVERFDHLRQAEHLLLVGHRPTH